MFNDDLGQFESIAYLCGHLTPTLLKLNVAKEKITDENITTLTQQCPNLQYLNISETLVSYQAITEITTGWKYYMVNLSLPQRMGFILTLHSSAPSIPKLKHFQSLINSMPRLKFLHVGHYKFHHADVMNRRRQVIKLSEMFPHLHINVNPFNSSGLVVSDPNFWFKNNIRT